MLSWPLLTLLAAAPPTGFTVSVERLPVTRTGAAASVNVTRVRLNPRDVSRFETAVQADFSLGKIQLIGDASLQPGDVMVDTASHTLDGRLTTRFEELVR